MVAPHLAGPLDRAVRELFGVSWGRARGWIASGKVRVSGAVVTEPTARVEAGVTLTVDERAARPRPFELSDSDVVYVDPHIVIVAKQPGISTVPYREDAPPKGPWKRAPAAGAEALEGQVRRWLERRGHSSRPGRPALGVVHRIDKETSGLVVFARTWLAKQRLASQFRHHTVHRRYLAIAHGDVPTRTHRSFLIEDRGDGLRGSARGRPGADAREAITHVERVEALTERRTPEGSGLERTVATLVACRLETGRTHQIRIHLSEAGHPIVGEKVYLRPRPGGAGAAPHASDAARTPRIDAPRLMLHAAELGFVHPASEREMRWELPLPSDMMAVLESLRGTR
jgi:23S rRNA pseudouridine1911/1915/1917 synthase